MISRKIDQIVGGDSILRFKAQRMKFRFSVKSLFIITTVIAVLMGIAIRLDLFSRQIIAAFALYFLVYLGVVCLFFGPRYFRELMEFREKRKSQRLFRAKLEEETSMLLAAVKANDQEQHEDGQEG